MSGQWVDGLHNHMTISNVMNQWHVGFDALDDVDTELRIFLICWPIFF